MVTYKEKGAISEEAKLSMTYKEFEKKFMKLYNQGLSTTDICEQLGENRQRGYGLIRRKGLVGHKYKSKKYTEEFLAKIKQEYLAGATVEQLENKYPDKKGSINAYLREMGITRPNGKRVYCNHNYFEVIDTPQKAYFLGLLTADGCIRHINPNQNSWSIRLELKVEDKYIIEEFVKAIDSNLSVKEYTAKNIKHEYNGKLYLSDKHNAYFITHSTKMAQDLIKWGCAPNKSKTCVEVPNIPKEMLRYYILGFFDGDGIASASKNRKYYGFVGTEPMMKSIAQILLEEINLPLPTVHYNKFSHIYFIQYRTTEKQLKFYHYLYDNLTIPHLVRKYEKMRIALGLEQ